MIDFLLGVPGRLKAIADLLAARLDTTISSRAAASTALSTATWTAARAGYLDKLSSGGIPGTVKSIQNFSTKVTISANPYITASAAQAITSVNTAKAHVIVHGWHGSSGSHDWDASAVLASATSVTCYITRPASGGVGDYCYVDFSVVEVY